MKTKLFAIAFATFMAACSSKPKTETIIADSANRTVLDKSQAIQMNSMSDTIIGSDGTKYVKASVKASPATTPVLIQPSPNTTTTITTRSGNSTVNSSGGTAKTYRSTTGSSTVTGPVSAQPKKKGWSKAAKGAVIGGASGAVAGAIISKNKGTGALVGGVLGAGAGYVIGRGKDKKDGRVKQ